MVEPAPFFARDRFAVSTVIFIRLFALVHLVAFASAWVQIQALIGAHGISPAGAYLAAARGAWGPAAYWQLPTLCWWFGTGGFLSVLCALGCGFALLLFFGVAPALSVVALWVAYLSLVNVGQMFFGYQWDGLLLEATLLAIWIVPWRWWPRWQAEEPPKVARLLVWWLTFRLMFLAGVVKLASGDPTWRNLTALTFHYETQPLPTPLAWYAHQAPLWWHKTECALTFAIELGLPFLLWLPRAARHAAALVLATFMAVIALTGNYTFFNALAIFLCLYCLDDAAWARASCFSKMEPRLQPRSENQHPDIGNHPSSAAEAAAPPDTAYPLVRHQRLRWPTGIRGWLTWVFAVFAFGFTGVLAIASFAPIGVPPGFRLVARWVEPLRSFNNYGLFAVMTHPRPELIVEGSYDGRDWHAYEFRYKPGALDERPKFVAPHQPRLDWQLWFAALEPADQNPWLLSLCEHLLRGTPQVLRLLGKNPFTDRPPKYIRVIRYEYHFTDAATRARTGNWWTRTPMDVYLPPSTLR